MKKTEYKAKRQQRQLKWKPKAPTLAQAAASLALGLFFSITTISVVNSAVDAATPYTIPTPPGIQVADAGAVTMHVYDYSDPNTLSLEDRGLYRMIDEAQASGDYRKADALFAKLSNRRLMGYALADRYLSSDYKASREELSYWLTYFGDQPQAMRVAALPAAQGLAVSLPNAQEPLRGDGYSQHLGRSTMPDRWYTALGKWREGNYAAAYDGFNAVSRSETNNWQASASHFWAYRAAKKLGDSRSASTHLAAAARYETTFYGLLANATRGVTRLDAEAPEVSDHLRAQPAAIRANLLAQLGRTEDAEAELRQLYSNVGENQRKGIVTLASELNLPNLQLRLANAPGLTPAEEHFARFPTPNYMVALDPIMDASLVMAVARNESGFRDDAVNKISGARGMMQMLPSTARAVERHVGEELLRTASIDNFDSPVAERLSDPSLSARYGAEYLKLLAKEPAIDRNLIHLVVGYNAGPGTAANWKAAGKNLDDPLLYIESIPYTETHNYVLQVLAQYWIYQMITDEKPVTLSALSHGQWPVIATAQ